MVSEGRGPRGSGAFLLLLLLFTEGRGAAEKEVCPPARLRADYLEVSATALLVKTTDVPRKHLRRDPRSSSACATPPTAPTRGPGSGPDIASAAAPGVRQLPHPPPAGPRQCTARRRTTKAPPAKFAGLRDLGAVPQRPMAAVATICSVLPVLIMTLAMTMPRLAAGPAPARTRSRALRRRGRLSPLGRACAARWLGVHPLPAIGIGQPHAVRLLGPAARGWQLTEPLTRRPRRGDLPRLGAAAPLPASSTTKDIAWCDILPTRAWSKGEHPKPPSRSQPATRLTPFCRLFQREWGAKKASSLVLLRRAVRRNGAGCGGSSASAAKAALRGAGTLLDGRLTSPDAGARA
jgi:hypothetical protein